MSFDWDKPIRFRDNPTRVVVDYARWADGSPAILHVTKIQQEILVKWEGPAAFGLWKATLSELENVPPTFLEQWCNVYTGGLGVGYASEQVCQQHAGLDALAKIQILIQNEGDKPVVTVHDV